MSLVSLSSRTIEELLGELPNFLPAGWAFDYKRTPGGYLEGFVVDGSGERQWESDQIDEKLLILDALGWLITRQMSSRNPVWVRGDVLKGPDRSPSTEFEDPGDIDPEEVSSVYGSRS